MITIEAIPAMDAGTVKFLRGLIDCIETKPLEDFTHPQPDGRVLCLVNGALTIIDPESFKMIVDQKKQYKEVLNQHFWVK